MGDGVVVAAMFFAIFLLLPPSYRSTAETVRVDALRDDDRVVAVVDEDFTSSDDRVGVVDEGGVVATSSFSCRFKVIG